MARVSFWVEFEVQDGFAEEFDQIMRDVIDCVRTEEPNSYAFWAYCSEDRRRYQMFEGFEDFDSALQHLSGEIGPVPKYVPRQKEIATISRLDIHGDLTVEQADKLLGILGGTYFATVAGFDRA